MSQPAQTWLSSSGTKIHHNTLPFHLKIVIQKKKRKKRRKKEEKKPPLASHNNNLYNEAFKQTSLLLEKKVDNDYER